MKYYFIKNSITNQFLTELAINNVLIFSVKPTFSGPENKMKELIQKLKNNNFTFSDNLILVEDVK